MNLAEFAAAVHEVTERADADLARECARVGANEYLAGLHVTTPVLSGALRASERVWRVWGGGTSAEAIIGPNIVYDKFRNDGGTIRVVRAKVLTNGSQFFGRQVTQKGSHYMERAVEWAAGPIQAAMQVVLDEIITLP